MVQAPLIFLALSRSEFASRHSTRMLIKPTVYGTRLWQSTSKAKYNGMTCVLVSCLASILEIHLDLFCIEYEDLGVSKVVLDDGRLSGYITKDGSFVMYATLWLLSMEYRINRRPGYADLTSSQGLISSQSNLMTAHSTPYVVPTSFLSLAIQLMVHIQLRIDVKPSESIPEVRPHVLGTPFNPASSIYLPYPVSLAPRSKNAYFVPRESFNLVGMFQNPMMMIMVFTGIMMFAMPYIMVRFLCLWCAGGSIDWITDAEKYGSGNAGGLQRSPGENGQYTKFNAEWRPQVGVRGYFYFPKTGFTGMLHSISALLAGDEEPKTSGARAQPTSQNRNRGTKNKKR